MATTPEKCRENVDRLREIMETVDQETRRKLIEVMRAWEDLCADLEAQQTAEAAE